MIIPARDEEATLPVLLASLAAQSLEAGEVIVIDDHSRDATAALAAAAGATVLANPPLPGGWTGKTWACHQGAAASSGELLVFLDADVYLAPDALACLADEHRRRRGIVSVQPFHRTEKPYESLSALCNVMTLAGTGAFTGWPRRPAAMAFGPCLVIGRRDYQQIGGHAHPAVRPLVTEDIGLAEVARQAGLPITLYAGRDLISFRMYPAGIGQLIEGWTKGLGAGGWRTPPLVAVASFAWVVGALQAAGHLASAFGRGSPARRSAAVYGAWAAQVAWMLRRVGRFGPWAAALYPIPLAAFVALFLRSAVLFTLRRPRTWRGRTVPDGPGLRPGFDRTVYG